MQTLDWTLIQTFLAVAETRSFSAAGKALSLSQPTVGRHIHALETHLGMSLFQRNAWGQRLTEAGVKLHSHALCMKEAAARLTMDAAGQSGALSGVVRITASVMVSHHILPAILARIHAAEPDIELELNPSDDTENLLFHEADIAVRMYRPEQLDVITRKVGELTIGLFAAHAYVAKFAAPRTAADLAAHDFIGFDKSDLMIRGMRALGFQVDRSFFALRCDNQTVYWELVRAGCGIGIAAENIGGPDPDMIRVLPDLELPTLPIWLSAHQALHTSPRIRRVYDFLAAELARIAPLAGGSI